MEIKEMTDDQIIEIAQNLYGGHLSEHVLHTHKTIEFARLIAEKQKEIDARICMGLCSVIEEPHEFERCAAAIRKGGAE